MEQFRDNQRVRVTRADHPLVGKVGRVWRLLRSEGRAWVNMDDDLPGDLRSFPESDPRKNHTLLFPSECEDAA